MNVNKSKRKKEGTIYSRKNDPKYKCPLGDSAKHTNELKESNNEMKKDTIYSKDINELW